ncbi:unnamed protein product [Arabidopsis halleri]
MFLLLCLFILYHVGFVVTKKPLLHLTVNCTNYYEKAPLFDWIDSLVLPFINLFVL